jgi:hypothetical protein
MKYVSIEIEMKITFVETRFFFFYHFITLLLFEEILILNWTKQRPHTFHTNSIHWLFNPNKKLHPRNNKKLFT